MSNPRTVLLAALATVIAVIIVLYLMGDLLLAFGFSGVVAYMLLPLVKLIERLIPWRERWPGLARTTAVLAIFLVVLALIGGVLFLIVPPTVRETTRFAQEFPRLFRDARMSVEEWMVIYSERVPEQVKQRIAEAASNAGSILLNSFRDVLSQSARIISTSLSLILGFAIAPILIFYLVKDSARIQPGLMNPFPSAMQPHIKNLLDIANRTVGGYIRGQLTLGLVVGTIVAIGLMILGVPFAFLLGVAAGITELIPFIGPWIGGAVGVLVTLATAPHLVLWVILLYVGVQLLENTVLVPRIQGHTLNLHPAVVLLVITISSQVWGIWGVILGPPVAALIKDLTVYFAEQWNLGRGPLAGEAETALTDHPPEAGPRARQISTEAGAEDDSTDG